MKPLYLSFLLFVPFALGARYYFVCDTLHWCARETLAPVAGAPVAVGMPDGREVAVALPEYRPGEAALPMSAAYATALDTLVGLTSRRPGQVLTIVGPVLPDETPGDASGRYADIGVARAAALSDALQARGVPAEQMALGSYAARDGGASAARLRFGAAVAKAVGGGLARVALLADSMAQFGLRFGRNSTALDPAPDFVAYADDLVAALNADTALRLHLIGHTDDRSTAAHNDTLGRWRAEAVAAFLQQRGLRADVSVESRGALDPAADNDTPEGRRLNRRVEARIQ